MKESPATGDLATELVGNKSSLSRKRNVLRCNNPVFLPVLCKVSRERRRFKPSAPSVRSPGPG